MPVEVCAKMLPDNAFGVQAAEIFTPVAKEMTENVKPPHFHSFDKCQELAVISTPREKVDFLFIRNNGQKIRFK